MKLFQLHLSVNREFRSKVSLLKSYASPLRQSDKQSPVCLVLFLFLSLMSQDG